VSIDQVDREQRDAAVDELFDEARNIYWQSGGQLDRETEENSIKAIMKLCWERWAEINP
jgi:hypothetical protein